VIYFLAGEGKRKNRDDWREPAALMRYNWHLKGKADLVIK